MKAIDAAQIDGMTRSATLFDIYRPKTAISDMSMDEKSLAVRLTFNSQDATMKFEAEDFDKAVASVLQQLQSAVGGRLRGA